MPLYFRKGSRDVSATQDELPTEVTMEGLDTPLKPGVSRCRAKWIYGFMLLMHFMLAIDTTSVAVALPAIAKEMNASKTAVFSLGTVFSLSATVFQQPVAELSHALGRKPAFIFVLGVFFVGSVVAATANNMGTLLAGRAMQGFASGGSVLTAIVLTDLIEMKDRAIWLTCQNGIQALGLVLGPLVGAGLLKTSWPWLFWINLPPIIVSATGLGLLLGFDRPEEGVLQSLGKVDWIGMIIFIPSVTAILVPFTMAGIIFKWNSPAAIAPVVLGVVGLVVLAIQQKHAKNPMFRPGLFAKRVTNFSFFGLGVFGVCVNMIFYYLVVYWSGVRGYSEVITGLFLLPETITIPVAAIVIGITMRQRGQIRWAMLLGWPLTTVSIGLLYFLDTQTHVVVLVFINLLVGLGAGTIVSALNVTLLASTKREDNGHAMAMGFLSKSAGMCLGIAIGTAVFTTQMDNRLKDNEDAEMVAESFMRMLHGVKDDPAGQEIIVRTLRILWWICFGLSFLAGMLCISCKYPGYYENGRAEGGPVELKHRESDSGVDSSSDRSSTPKDLSRHAVSSVGSG